MRAHIAPFLLTMFIVTPALAGPALPGGIDKDVEAETFRYRFIPGEVVSYRDRVVQTAETGENTVKTTLTSTQDVKTTQVAPGGAYAKIESRRNKVAIAIQEGGVSVPTASLQPVVKALEQIRLSARVSTRGEQTNVNVEHVSVRVQQLLDSFGQAMVGASPVFPEQAVALGHGWTQALPFDVRQGPAQIRMNFEVAYTYEGQIERAGRKMAVLSATTTLQVHESKVPLPEAEMLVSGNGSGQGVLLFDLEWGRIGQVTLASTQRLTLEVTGAEAPPKLTILLQSEAFRSAAGPSKAE